MRRLKSPCSFGRTEREALDHRFEVCTLHIYVITAVFNEKMGLTHFRRRGEAAEQGKEGFLFLMLEGTQHSESLIACLFPCCSFSCCV